MDQRLRKNKGAPTARSQRKAAHNVYVFNDPGCWPCSHDTFLMGAGAVETLTLR